MSEEKKSKKGHKKLSYGDAVKIFAILAKKFSGKTFTINDATRVLYEKGIVIDYYRLIHLFYSFEDDGLIAKKKIGNTNYYAIKI
ncbi:MAG: hypothetical protein KatS3mg083_514 [Candidatus Dojkabacteria bacterium]|nr:MAG: hypothetical protein KatS3mg083_514 [Candidatus Dojkabacteria bacterium]